jgi:hypothetical protein
LNVNRIIHLHSCMRPGRGWGGTLTRTTSSVVSYKVSDPRAAESLNTKI